MSPAHILRIQIEQLRDKLQNENRTDLFKGHEIASMLQRRLVRAAEGHAAPEQQTPAMLAANTTAAARKVSKTKPILCQSCGQPTRYTSHRRKSNSIIKCYNCPACNHRQRTVTPQT